LNPLTWLKSQFTPGRYLDSSVRIVEGSGTHGAKSRPFNQQAAVNQFRSWVYAAAMLNSQAVAAVPLRLYVRTRPGQKLWATRAVGRKRLAYLSGAGEDRPSGGVLRKAAEFNDEYEEVTELHPALEALQRVNPFLNGFNLTTLRMLYLELTGNAYIHPVIDKATGIPAELWPMPSQWVSIIPDRVEFVKGYVYGQNSATAQTFEPEEVIHFRYPNPDNLYYGKGKVEAGWSIIGLQQSKREMDAAFYDNMARPDYAVIVKGSGATETQLERFEQRFEERLRGTKKSGRAMAYGGDVTITPLSFPPKDLGDPEAVVEEIAGVFGVPVSKLKANDPNRANAETGDAGWMKDTILPLLRQDEEKLNEGYLPLFGIEDDAFLAYDNPVPENRTFDLDRRTRLVTGGILTINEARSDDGMEPVEGGDLPRVNGTPLDKIGVAAPGGFGGFGGFSVAPSPQNAPSGPTVAQGASLDTVALLADVRQVVRREIRRGKRKEADHADSSPVRGGGVDHAGVDHRHVGEPVASKADGLGDAADTARAEESEALIRRLWAAVAAVLEQQLAEVERAVRGGGKSARVLKALEADLAKLLIGLAPALREAILPVLQAIIARGGTEGLLQIGVEGAFDISNPAVAEWINQHTLQLTDAITRATVEQITPVVRDAIARDLSPAEMTGAIRESGAFDGMRAERIARTESAQAHMEGAQQAWKDSGVVKGKTWLLGGSACEFCRAAAAEFNDKVVALDDAFYEQGYVLTGADGGTMKLDYKTTTGPPLHPNCRCTLVAVLE